MYSLCSWWVNNEQSNINQTSIKPKGFRASWLVWWTKTEVCLGSSLNSENQNHFVNKFKDVTCTDSWALFDKILIETELARTTDTLLWSDRLHVDLPKGGSYKQNEFVSLNLCGSEIVAFESKPTVPLDWSPLNRKKNLKLFLIEFNRSRSVLTF